MKLAVASLLIGSAAAFNLNMKAGEIKEILAWIWIF
jgi:hypothetical protein